MGRPRVGILPPEERMAIIQGARQLKLDPYEFGAFLSLESGPNMDPNIVGGAGGRHKGLIQFGQNEQKQYGISGPQTRAGQMPAVLRYFEDRGFKPGMGIGRAYATVLGGNPNVSLNARDSFGTSVAGALPRFRKGGDLYENARRVLGDIPDALPLAPQGSASAAPASAQAPTPSQQRNVDPNQFLKGVVKNLIPALMQRRSEESSIPNPYAGVASIDPNLLEADDEIISYMQGIS